MPLRILPNGAFAGDTLLDALQVRDAERLRRYREYLAFYEGRHWTSRPRNSPERSSSAGAVRWSRQV